MNRIVTGIIIAIGWLLLLFKGPYELFCIVIAASGGVGLYEFLRMSSPDRETGYIYPVLMIGLLPFLGAAMWGILGLTMSVFLSLFAMVFLAVAVSPTLENGLVFLSRQWFGISYIGFCASHLILLRALPQGVSWLLVLTAITVLSDTGAYYVGKSLGKNKLFPTLSPGKTREGAAGGIVGGILGGTLAAALLFGNENILLIAVLSLVLSVIGILGDLLESMVKRTYGIKDSGRILPGHGGLLDRCDSILLTAPVLYYALAWVHTLLFR